MFGTTLAVSALALAALAGTCLRQTTQRVTTTSNNADYNMSGQTNSPDFFDFLSCFFTGCS